MRSIASKHERVDLLVTVRKVFLQFGQDGVIEKIFEVIEPTPKFIFDFCASHTRPRLCPRRKRLRLTGVE